MDHQQDLVGATECPLDRMGLCLLSLDGGGVRGLSTLLILKGLMDRINAESRGQGRDAVKPCEIFDLIGGTSTGGLIAIMLGHLMMDVDECIIAYKSMFENIFEKRKRNLPVSLRGKVQAQFDSRILMESISEIVKSRPLESDLFNTDGERNCRVFVCATACEDATTVHLRDYTLPDEPSNDRPTIVEAALATSAATTFFDPVTIGGRKFVDGALGSNNPVDQVWSEAQNIWCPDDGQLEPMIKCFVSIGTGDPGPTPIRESASKFLTKTLKGIATETKRTAERFAKRYRGLLDKKRYFRFNVEQGLETIGLNEYQKQPQIETVTLTYLASQTQKFNIRDCAGNLMAKQSPTPLQFSLVTRRDNDELLKATHSLVVSTIHYIVPFPSSEEFTGREYYISRLEDLMCVPGKHCRVALVGLGGIGKTRIALEFAIKYRTSKSTSVFWVHAGTAPRMEKAYLDIAKTVKVKGWDSQDPAADKLQLVKDWFESEESGNWILIVDNADDIDLMYGDSPKGDGNDCERENHKSGGDSHGANRSLSQFASYFPRSPNGSILLTTRNKKVGIKFASVSNILPVTALTTAESERLLSTRLWSDESEMHEIANLADVLERVPLALVQAAAFISAESSSVTEYLKLHSESDAIRIKLLSDDFEDDVRDPDIKNPVATTFAISFTQIKKQDPLAADVLSTMSMLDAQAIPRSLLPFDEDPVDFTKALGTLQAYSLITSRKEQSSQKEQQGHLFDLHRLVRLAMRNWLSMNNELETWISNTIIKLNERFPPGSYENRDAWRAYLPHSLALLSFDRMLPQVVLSPMVSSVRKTGEERIAEAALRFRVSQYLRAKGNYQSAESMAQKSLTLRETTLGEEHLDSLTSMDNLALVLRHQGKYLLAEEVNRRALRGREKVLGKEHSDTLQSMDNLAWALQDQGKYTVAEEMSRRALKGREKTLGEEHPDTLTSMDNLVWALRSQGKFEEAEEVGRRALEGRERTLGNDHPDTLTSASSLAQTLHDRGKYEAAEKMNRRALEGRERGLGKEHPDTLVSVYNLATLLSEQGKYEVAEEMHRWELRACEKAMGKDHPDTLISMIGLATALRNQKKYEAAEEMNRRAMEGYEAKLGKEHPYSLLNMSNLAMVLQGQGKYKAAEEMNRQVLEEGEKALGMEHPYMLKSMCNLALVLHAQGKDEEAEELSRRALEGKEKALGKEHPDALTSVNDLAVLLHSRKQYDAASALYQRALSGYGKTLGLDHPRVLKCSEDYAAMLEEMQGQTQSPRRREDLATEDNLLVKPAYTNFPSSLASTLSKIFYILAPLFLIILWYTLFPGGYKNLGY